MAPQEQGLILKPQLVTTTEPTHSNLEEAPPIDSSFENAGLHHIDNHGIHDV